MKYEKYVIKKGKEDLLSSLKALDKKIIKEKLEENGLDNIKELKDHIIDEFEICLEMSKDDVFTQMYFEKIMENENSALMSAYEQDIKSLWVFVYENEGYYSYYIPTEIKEIINKLLIINKETKMNLENAAETEIIKDLKELLNVLTQKDLNHIGKMFKLKKISSKPKKELVKIIYNALTSEEKLEIIIERLIDKEFNLLKDLVENKGKFQDNNIEEETYHILYLAGIIFLFKKNNKFYISMTDDVYKIIKKMDLNKYKKTVEENTKVYNLTRSMIELYGAVSHADIDEAYSLYYGNGKKIKAPLNTLSLIERADNIEIKKIDDEKYFVHVLLIQEELNQNIYEILMRQLNTKRKPIKLNELLKYSDYDYYEKTKQKSDLIKYLKKNGMNNHKAEETIIIISSIYRLGYSFINITFEVLKQYGFKVTKDNSDEILNYLIKIYNNTRVWTNNGWTPEELRKK